MNSKTNIGKIGICGHIGVGHTHSHSGFVQDDGAGFAVVATLLKKAYPIDTTIINSKVNIEDSTITIETKDGGIGEVFIPVGVTPWEVKIIESIKGKDGIFNQKIVLESFGRIYGQGVMEVPTSLQCAISLSVLDTFVKKYPGKFLVEDENIPSNNGRILGATIEIENIPIAIMLSINSTKGGMGPVEDLEGNIPLGNKGKVMKNLNLERIPTIVVESKNYSPNLSDNLESETFLIRWNKNFDNVTVGKSLIEGAKMARLPWTYNDEAFPRDTSDLSNSSILLGDKIIELGKDFKDGKTSEEKVDIIYRLNKIVREEAGGVTFMSNDLNRSVGGAGILKGTSSVLSLVVNKEYIEREKIPYLNEDDIKNYIDIIVNAIPEINKNINIAMTELKEKWDFVETDYKYLFEKRKDKL